MISLMLVHQIALLMGRLEPHAPSLPGLTVLYSSLVLDQEGLVHPKSLDPA